MVQLQRLPIIRFRILNLTWHQYLGKVYFWNCWIFAKMKAHLFGTERRLLFKNFPPFFPFGTVSFSQLFFFFSPIFSGSIIFAPCIFSVIYSLLFPTFINFFLSQLQIFLMNLRNDQFFACQTRLRHLIFEARLKTGEQLAGSSTNFQIHFWPSNTVILFFYIHTNKHEYKS